MVLINILCRLPLQYVHMDVQKYVKKALKLNIFIVNDILQGRLSNCNDIVLLLSNVA